MKPLAKRGNTAPLLQLSDWVQGGPSNLDQLLGSVVLIEVFQVNCPGCFLYSLPQAIDLYQRYHAKGLTVIGMATAFEDFDKNTVENLKLTINQDTPIAETLRVLEQNNRLINGQLPYHIPFPVAMDSISKQQKEITEDEITQFVEQHVRDFSRQENYQQEQIRQQALNYLQSHLYQAETFQRYNLQGTPSHIIVDKKGILRASEFGHFTELEWSINILLQE